jgi:DNA integrity scanning protein DisA with diadenylate cyclase activity
VLTPNGEIKAFADGRQVFNFLDGRWRLSDTAEKYEAWAQAMAGTTLAERLFTTALNLAERRRGGLFVVLDDGQAADRLVPPNDRVDLQHPVSLVSTPARSKNQFHYLLRGTSILDLTPTVLESIARIDGAIVLDRTASLLAFGAILRHQLEPALGENAVEGGRTSAAIAASRYGHVLKVSEDGLVSYYSGGRCVWEL